MKIARRKASCRKGYDLELYLMVEFTESRVYIKANLCIETFNKLHQEIIRKRSGKLTDGVTLFHDNARLHVAKIAKENLQRKK